MCRTGSCYCIIKPFGASAAVTTDTGCLQMLLQDMGRRPCGKKWERFTDVSCISVTSQREVGRASIAGEMMNVLKEMKEKCCNEGNTLRFRFRVWIVAEPSWKAPEATVLSWSSVLPTGSGERLVKHCSTFRLDTGGWSESRHRRETLWFFSLCWEWRNLTGCFECDR